MRHPPPTARSRTESITPSRRPAAGPRRARRPRRPARGVPASEPGCGARRAGSAPPRCRGSGGLPRRLLPPQRDDLRRRGRRLSRLSELCVADRWRDLAVATWSVTWNLGPGYEDLFLASYGIARDEGAQAFYRLLYDLES